MNHSGNKADVSLDGSLCKAMRGLCICCWAGNIAVLFICLGPIGCGIFYLVQIVATPFAFGVARHLREEGNYALAFLVLIPILGLVPMFLLASRGAHVLADSGVRVGFLGPRSSRKSG